MSAQPDQKPPLPIVVQHRSSPTRTPRGVFSGWAQSLKELLYRLVALFFFKVLTILRPISPQLVPLVVFLLSIPLLVILAVSVGWIVWRSVAVNWNVEVYLQYGDGVPPYALVNVPKLVPLQPYDISLHLVIPACESNFALGNFMTSLTLSTLMNDTLTTVRRPTIALQPKTNSWLLPSGHSNVVEFDVALLRSYTPPISNILAYIQLGRQDGWKSIGHGEGREISVLSASLGGVVKHQGIRGLITRFPLTVALVSVFAFFTVTCIILAACFLPVIMRRSGDEVVPTESPPTPITPVTPLELAERQRPILQTPEAEDEKLPRRQKRLRRSRSRSSDDTLVFKTEVPTLIMPSAPSQPTPIRQRRSRASDSEA